MIRQVLAVSLVAALAAFPAHADDKHHRGGAAAATADAADAQMADGEVRRVDKDAKKITIKHGPLARLDMPAMTMVFQVSEPAMLDKVKPGDRIRFDAEKIGGGYRVTRIEPVRN